MKEYKVTGNKDTRSGFGAGLVEAGRRNKDVVALCADLTGSVKMDLFAQEFPERMIQCGIAEADMIGIAAGLALSGKVAFAGSFAAFATGRVYDQIRQAVAYSDTNVKIAGSHAGITLGEDGATHQILEDLGLMKMLPNMVLDRSVSSVTSLLTVTEVVSSTASVLDAPSNCSICWKSTLHAPSP